MDTDSTTSGPLITENTSLFFDNVTIYINNSTKDSDYIVDQADDAIWILTSTFIIFTMQSGFGLLESGSVTSKNEVNIMVKNAVDVIVGGLSFWAFGYAFSFGTDSQSNWFSGWGYFFVSCTEEELGTIYPKFFFQASFATTATTIVSGGMAERTKLEAYIVFSFLNTLVFCFPAHWVWAKDGWLKKMGIIGAGPVHLVGGTTGLIATLLLKPRFGRYENKSPPQMGSPTNAILGMFMLWWGWLGFNCGSTFGISGFKWKLAARSAVATLGASIGGGSMALFLSYVFKKRKFEVTYMINGILGSLVGITAICALAQPWEGFIIGMVGAMVALGSIELLDKLEIDDPVGCVGVHAVSAMWSLLSVGLLARPDKMRESLGVEHSHAGLFTSSSWYLLGIQTLGIVSIASWTALTSFLLLKAIDLTIGLRVSLPHEILGADIVEHSIGDIEYDKVNSRIIHIGKKGCVNSNGSVQRRRSIYGSRKEDSEQNSTRDDPSNTTREPSMFQRDEYQTMWKYVVSKSLEKTKQRKRKKSLSFFSNGHTKLKKKSSIGRKTSVGIIPELSADSQQISLDTLNKLQSIEQLADDPTVLGLNGIQSNRLFQHQPNSNTNGYYTRDHDELVQTSDPVYI